MAREEMQEVEMMMTLTDVASWPSYNVIIDIFLPKKVRAGRTGFGVGEVCANTIWVFLIIMGHNTRPRLFSLLFLVCVRVRVCVCVSQKTQRTHSVLATVKRMC